MKYKKEYGSDLVSTGMADMIDACRGCQLASLNHWHRIIGNIANKAASMQSALMSLVFAGFFQGVETGEIVSEPV